MPVNAISIPWKFKGKNDKVSFTRVVVIFRRSALTSQRIFPGFGGGRRQIELRHDEGGRAMPGRRHGDGIGESNFLMQTQ